MHTPPTTSLVVYKQGGRSHANPPGGVERPERFRTLAPGWHAREFFPGRRILGLRFYVFRVEDNIPAWPSVFGEYSGARNSDPGWAEDQIARDPARIDALSQTTAIVQIALINKRGGLQAIAWDHANV